MRTMKLSCEQIHFLGVCTQIPSEQFLSEPVKIWERLYTDGTMDRLLQVTGATKVYGVSGYYCDMEGGQDSYYIVCENKNGADEGEFVKVDIEPTTFMAFEQKGTDPLAKEKEYAELYEEVYKRWLPDSDYEALTDPFVHTFTKGTAILESILPKEPESTNYEIEIWLPIKRPNGYQSESDQSLSETVKNFRK